MLINQRKTGHGISPCPEETFYYIYNLIIAPCRILSRPFHSFLLGIIYLSVFQKKCNHQQCKYCRNAYGNGWRYNANAQSLDLFCCTDRNPIHIDASLFSVDAICKPFYQKYHHPQNYNKAYYIRCCCWIRFIDAVQTSHGSENTE